MNGVDIIKLSADLAVGSITADLIREQYGDNVLASVLSVAGGVGAGAVTHAAVDAIDRATGGIVSDVGGIIDDIFDW